ncbi:hypothetical protein [Micromonospora globbae]|uniref:hypothetical protein n=1 Tax=Micromonospora globbae TaxID=1894969 RepID=UPI00343BFC8A
MIPAPRGLVARYKHTNPDHYTTKPVVAFDDDGRPLIMHETNNRLTPADIYSNFADVAEDPCPNIVAIMPAGGWRVAYATDDGGEWSTPLVGWGVKADGTVVPLDCDPDGNVEDFDHLGGKWRIYHPDAKPSTEQEKTA